MSLQLLLNQINIKNNTFVNGNVEKSMNLNGWLGNIEDVTKQISVMNYIGKTMSLIKTASFVFIAG